MEASKKIPPLRILLTLSLGIHVLFLFIASGLFSDFGRSPLPVIPVEVSFLPPVLVSMAEVRPVIKAPVKREEEKILEEVRRTPREEPQQEEIRKEEPLPRIEPILKTELVPKTEPVPKTVPVQDMKPAPETPSPVLTSVNPSPAPIVAAPQPITQKEEGNMGVDVLVPRTRSTPQPSTNSEPIMIAMAPTVSGNAMRIPFQGPPSQETPTNLANIPPAEEKVVFARPKYAENPKPFYPVEAKRKGYQGETLLRVEVLSNGQVGQIQLKKSSGHEILDRSALDAVKQWKFTPAKKGDSPVPQWVNIPVVFRLQ